MIDLHLMDLHPVTVKCAACGKPEEFDELDYEFSRRVYPGLAEIPFPQRGWICKACTRMRFAVGNAVIHQAQRGNWLVRLLCWWMGIPTK